MIRLFSSVVPLSSASVCRGKSWAPNIHKSSTATDEAPFSSTLQSKLPLWKYLIAHNGKTRFSHQLRNSEMLKPSSSGKLHAYSAILPETRSKCESFSYMSWAVVRKFASHSLFLIKVPSIYCLNTTVCFYETTKYYFGKWICRNTGRRQVISGDVSVCMGLASG